MSTSTRSATRLAVAGLFAISAFALAACGTSSAEEVAAAKLPQVSVAAVPFKTLNDWHELTGRIEAVQQVEIRPRVAGFIESTSFTEGALVKKGQLLFQIDARPFAAQVERLEAELARARAQHQLAQANRARSEALIEQGAISREEHDRLGSGEAVAAAEVAAVQANLRAARLDLSYTRVTAPVDGRVSRALITAGNLVSAQSLLTTVVSVNPVRVAFDLDEQTYLSALGQDQKAQVYVGLMDEQGTPHAAKLDFVDNATRNGLIRVRATVDNDSGRLTPGLFARVKLVAGQSFEAALVDDRAIGTDLGRKYVLAMTPDHVTEYRAITTGPRVDGLRVIREGLRPGDVVVVNGLQRVRPGLEVEPQRVAMGEGRDGLIQVSAAEPAVKLASLAGAVRAAK
ncbi:MAG: efflux RND transporter periplasmic adaptor subunit [Stagnimonas sp.]|nr:efflux RND transporter periplasmic adaptor subunit [Stagnimonas sp.]